MPPITRKTPKASRVEELTTGHGPARAHIFAVPHGVPRASLILGHGAGGGVNSPDLATLADELPGLGIEVVLVEQPWKVAGKKTASAASVLDSGWIEIVAGLRRSGVGLRRLVVGGRSSGARVACRTAARTKPAALLCLAFPLYPSRQSDNNRSAELAAGAAVAPTTVIQGTADRFGGPPEVALLAAEHGQRVLAAAIPFADHSFHLRSKATITDAEARLILIIVAQRAVLRPAGNTGPLLAR